jgi:hypothetical protein
MRGSIGQEFTLNKKFQEYTLIQNIILVRTAESETVPMKYILVLVHFRDRFRIRDFYVG